MISATLGSAEFDGVLSLSSLFERDFSIDWLVSLNQKKASQVISAFEAGVNKGWLKSEGGGRYSFVDTKCRKAWRDTLNPEEKNQLHKQIFQILSNDLPEDD